LSAITFPDGFTPLSRYDCPVCTEAVRVMGGVETPLSSAQMEQLQRQTVKFAVDAIPGGLIYISRRHAVRYSFVAGTNCELILPKIRDLSGTESVEFRGLADGIYHTLHQTCLGTKPGETIATFDIDKLLALPIFAWVADSLGKGAPLALMPGAGESLVATLLYGNLQNVPNLTSFSPADIAALPGRFLSDIDATIKH